jgi:protein O-mannosyl-transferase
LPARAAVWLSGPWGLGLMLAALTFVVFWPVVNCEFINFDDPEYVTENPHVLAGPTWRSLLWCWRADYASNWHPLTWLSHILDVGLFGRSPAGPHLVNLPFHTANTVLVYVVLKRLTHAQWPSAMVAAFFGWHPLHVESVAWISERKDVLSAFFFMLTLWAYVRHVEKSAVRSQWSVASDAESEACPGQKGLQTTGHGPRTTHPAPIFHPPSSNFYFLSLAFFALGLMSKPMLVTVPFVLLLLDYWPLGRFGRKTQDARRKTFFPLLFEKTPFFVLSALSCVTTYWAQAKGESVSSLADLSVRLRLENALLAYARYLGKTFWPTDLAIFYPHPGQWPWPAVAGASLLVAGVSAAALWWGRRRPFLVTGWFWFAGTLVPVSGLVQVGRQSMADRYTYVPLIGLFIVAAWAATEVTARGRCFGPWRVLSAITGGLVLLVCAVQTRVQLRYWRSTETVFAHALAVTQNNDVACNNLGAWLEEQGRADEALDYFSRALRVAPNDTGTLNNMALALANKGRLPEAINCCRHALELDPGDKAALNTLGIALTRRGGTEEAIETFRRALELDPDYPKARNNLGLALARQGRFAEAMECYHQALQINPNDVEALNNLGIALARVGRRAEALDSFGRAVEIAPDFADALNNLGVALVAKGRRDEAVEHFRRALRSKPNDPEALNHLGNALADTGNAEEAIACFRQALQINPNSAEALNNLAYFLARRGQVAEAISCYRKVTQLNTNDARAFFNLSSLLAGENQVEEAIEELQRAVRLDPKLTEARNNLGGMLASQKRYGAAIAQFQEVLRLKPDDAGAHFNLGKALALKGRVEEALKHYRRAQQLAPDDLETASNLAWLLATARDGGLRDGAEAVRLAQMAERLSGGKDAGALDALAAALAEKGRFAEAVPAAQRALEAAQATGQSNLAAEIQARLKLYNQGQPFRAP